MPSTPVSATFNRHSLRKVTATRSLMKTLRNTTCAICIDDFKCEDQLIKLPKCNHIFHRNCILPWFARNNTCPICRQVFQTEPQPQPQPSTDDYVGVEQTIQISTQLHILRQRPPFCYHPTNTIYFLTFRLLPLSPPSQLLPDNRELEECLIREGYSEWATRATGPYSISTETINLPSGTTPTRRPRHYLSRPSYSSIFT